jgi:hypothetical protein
MIVDFLGVSVEQALLLNLLGLATLLGAVMLMLSRAMQGTGTGNGRGRRGASSSSSSSSKLPMLLPVTLRIAPRPRRTLSHGEPGFPPGTPSRAPPTLSRSARQQELDGGCRSRE